MCVIWVIKEFADCSSFQYEHRSKQGKGLQTPHGRAPTLSPTNFSRGPGRDRTARCPAPTLTHAWCPDAAPFRGRRLHIEAQPLHSWRKHGQEDCRCGRPCAGSQAKMVSRWPCGGHFPPRPQAWSQALPTGKGPAPATPTPGRLGHPVASASSGGRAVHCPPGSPRALRRGKAQEGLWDQPGLLFPEAEPLGWNAPGCPQPAAAWEGSPDASP